MVSGAGEETFGQRIQRRRRDLRLTQRVVAADIGIDFTYLSKLENDRGEPPGERTVRRLAEILKDDSEELLALAGKIPLELRERASEDTDFAMLLRTLPKLPDDRMDKVYRAAGVQRRKRRP